MERFFPRDWKEFAFSPRRRNGPAGWGGVGSGEGVDRKELISWLFDGHYPDAVFDHMMVMAPDGYEISQSSTHKTDRTVSDHRAVVLELPRLPDFR